MNTSIDSLKTFISKDIIILIHGLMRKGRCMKRLGKYLLNKGYNVVIYDYKSTKYSITEHGKHLSDFIENLIAQNPTKSLHFITHSLGGIIAREALSKLLQIHLAQCKNLIMLAPPNKGSFAARICTKWFPFITSAIKPLAELSSSKEAYVHAVTTPPLVKIGIIAGRFDAKTPPATTSLPHQTDFILVNSAHTFIMNHSKTKQSIINFLQKGSF